MAATGSSRRDVLESFRQAKPQDSQKTSRQSSDSNSENANPSGKAGDQQTAPRLVQHISSQKKKSVSRSSTSQTPRSRDAASSKPGKAGGRLSSVKDRPLVESRSSEQSQKPTSRNNGSKPGQKSTISRLEESALMKQTVPKKYGRKSAAASKGKLPVPPAIRMRGQASAKVLSPAAAVAAAARDRAAGIARAKPQPKGRFDSMQPGRQFTVGNIGANGLITLRPMVKSAADMQRQRQPVYPFDDVMPPLEKESAPAPTRRRNSSVGAESMFSSAMSISQHHNLYRRPSLEPSSSGMPSRKGSTHFRSHSFSTMDERMSRALSRHGTIRSANRSTPRRGRSRAASEDKLSENVNSATIPAVPPMPDVLHLPSRSATESTRPSVVPTSGLSLLNQINIPSFRLDNPHFGSRGSTLLRVSKSTRPDTSRSRSREELPISASQSRLSSSRMSLGSGVLPLDLAEERDEVLVPRAPVLSSPRGSISQFAMSVFEELAHNPDDPAFVRFNPDSDEIMAATPSRLVAHITSPSFLDYELLSDFFLTFRAFLVPNDLVSYLVARLRWAVERIDDFGRIVRVRTFVALRHWILNYYSDDFAPDFALRVHFCDLVNGLFQDLQRRADGGGGDLKIIGELKKCWRRTCAVYWPSEKGVTAIDEDIFPGGRYESIYWEGEDTELSQLIPSEHTDSQALELNARGGSIEKVSGHRVTYSKASNQPSVRIHEPQQSPVSIQSLHVISCSFPFKPLFKHQPEKHASLFPHPVQRPQTPISNVSVPGKGGKRNVSSVESTREPLSGGTKVEGLASGEEEENTQAAPGSLVHGALYPPVSPYFEIRTMVMTKAQNVETQATSNRAESPTSSSPVKTTSGENMKKMLGNMRRAFTNNLGIMSPIGVPHSPAVWSDDHKSSETTLDFMSAQMRDNKLVSTAQIRIDILTSTAGEAFRLAVELEQSGEVDDSGNPVRGSAQNSRSYSMYQQYLSTFKEPIDKPASTGRSVTVGSRSIVIFDDTNTEGPLMSGALSPDDAKVPSRSFATGATDSYHEQIEQSGRIAPRGSLAQESSDQTRNLSRKQHTPAVYVPGMSRPAPAVAAAGAVYVPTGFRKSERLSVERLFRSSRGSFRNSLHSNAASSSIRRYSSYHSGYTGSIGRKSLRRGSLQGRSSNRSSSAISDKDHTPTQPLRRRAGGNLKAAQSQSIASSKVARRHSAGTVSSVSRSRPGSTLYRSSKAGSYRLPVSPVPDQDEGSADEHASNKSTKARENRGRSISLIQTHSSQPNLRPSFEAEVAKLKALPDDDDDGGIETTLLKLEGRYERKSPASASEQESSSSEVDLHDDDEDEDKHRKHHEHVEDIHAEESLPLAPPSPDHERTQTKSIIRLSDSPIHSRAASQVQSPPKKVQRGMSYKSTRSQKSFSKKSAREASIASSARAPPPSEAFSDQIDSARPPPVPMLDEEEEEEAKEVAASLDLGLARQQSMASSKRRASKKRSVASRKAKKNSQQSINAATSFLFDEASDDSDEENEDDESFYDDNAAEDDESEEEEEQSQDDELDASQQEDEARTDQSRPEHDGNLRRSDTPERLVPPIAETSRDPTHLSPNRGLKDDEVALSTSPVLPTSQVSSARKAAGPRVNVPNRSNSDEKETSPTIRNSIMHPPHLPFILAYEAEHLAQQLTILERDALEELDWRELIDMKWNQSPVAASDWVAYLRTTDPFGVGLVIARFNLMVKWVISQVILTDQIHERVRTISHYIRIAAHCRVLRNFATMYQITVALLSPDCSHLKKTWSFVPSTEMSVLQDLERLVQPIRNFHNLRMEMEIAPTDAGCIPFIGIYTRDLVYNAQKPAFVTSPPQNAIEPLVNFERHSTSAGIVKSLLRLLEQSAKYTFAPDAPCLARCLWVAALDEAEIRVRGDRLE